jgi:tetratricopeptide (TPR) repeat protein
MRVIGRAQPRRTLGPSGVAVVVAALLALGAAGVADAGRFAGAPLAAAPLQDAGSTEPPEPPEPPEVVPAAPGPRAQLPAVPQQYQTMNNCGPATAAMALGLFGHRVSQEAARQALRPGGYDDKNLTPEELAAYLEGFGLETRLRAAGDPDRLRALLANGIPVVVHQALAAEAGKHDIGHFALVRGYDDAAGVLLTQDPYYGPGRRLPVAEFDRLWRAFNRRYLPVLRPRDAPLVRAILGEDWDAAANWARAQRVAEQEVNRSPGDPYAWFNLGDSHLGQGDAPTAAHAYERALALGLPRRHLWYRTGPLAAHNRAGDHRRALALAQQVLATEATLAEAHHERGLALLGLGQRAAALDAFRLAARYGPNLGAAHEMLAQLSAR